MNSHQLQSELSTALAYRSRAGAEFEAASAILTTTDHAVLNAGVPINELTPAQAEFCRALRAYNAALDEVEYLAEASALSLACDQFEESL